MTHPNATRSLPPGDRDDAPMPSEASPVAGRETAERQTAEPQTRFPGLDLAIAAIGHTPDDAGVAFGDIKLERGMSRMAALEAAAHRLAALSRNFAATVTSLRHVERRP